MPDKTRIGGCGECICQRCLYYWSQRCPHGGCYDHYRALNEPYYVLHMAEPERTAWSNWNLPGEQNHWCRGGIFYPAESGDCGDYQEYKGATAEQCLFGNVLKFQDGYIICAIVDNIGCEKCMEMFEAELEKEELND